MENMIKNARVVSDQSREDEVGLNDTVTLYFEDDEEEDVYRLVTSIRGNSLENKISIESPLGKAIRGCRVGERAYVKINDKADTMWKSGRLRRRETMEQTQSGAIRLPYLLTLLLVTVCMYTGCLPKGLAAP